MGFFDLFRRERKASFIVSDDALPFFLHAPTAAGIAVAGEKALQSPTALACCTVISQVAGGLPLKVFKRTADGKERHDAHAADSILSRRANAWTGAAELRTRLVLDALLYGRGIGLIIRTGRTVREVHRIDPQAVSVDTTGKSPIYTITDSEGRQTSHRYTDIIDLRAPGGTVDRPFCIVREAREVITLDIQMTKFFAKLVSKDAKPSAVVTSEGDPVAPAAWKEMREWFREQLTNPEADGTLFVPGQFRWTPQSMSSVDMEWTSNHGAVRQAIARAFNVPQTAIGILDKASFRNTEHLFSQWLATGLRAWLEQIENAFSVLLDDDTLFLETVTDDLLRADTAARFAAYRQACGSAWLTVNEIRALDNRSSLGEIGDELVRQAGQTAADEPQTPPDDNDDKDDK